jgi:hypothetical protein
MVDYSVGIAFRKFIFVLLDLSQQEIKRIHHLLMAGLIVILADTLLTLRITNDGSSRLLVVACKGKAPWQEGNRILIDINSC